MVKTWAEKEMRNLIRWLSGAGSVCAHASRDSGDVCLCVPCLPVSPSASLPADLLWFCQGQGLSGLVQSFRCTEINRGNVSGQIGTTVSPGRTNPSQKKSAMTRVYCARLGHVKSLGSHVRFRVYCEADKEPVGFEAGKRHDQVGRMTCHFVQVLELEAVFLGPGPSVVLSSSVQLWTHLYILCRGTFVSSKGIFRLPHLTF